MAKPMMEQEKINQATTATDAQYETLLEVVESIALHRDLASLLHDLAQRLPRVIRFTGIALQLHDPVQDKLCEHVLKTERPICQSPTKEELPAEETPSWWVWQTQQALWIPDLESETRFPRMMDMLRAYGIKSAGWFPLTTALRRLGTLAFSSDKVSAYSESETRFMQQVAKQVALAVDNALNFQSAQSYQQQLALERDHLRLLLDVNNVVVSTLDLRELLGAISTSLRRVMPHEYASLSLYDPETYRLQIHALDFPASKGQIQEGLSVRVEESPDSLALTSREPVLLTRQAIEQFHSEFAQRILAEGIKSACFLPLVAHSRILGTLVVASLREATFPKEDAERLRPVANQIAIAIENALAFHQVVDLANKLIEEKLYLEDEIRTEYNFEEIIGESTALKRVLKQVETVAPTDSTVLILGESGTGKELIARALHNLSARRERTFMKVNCAAIPTGLLESELFGHEKGAFTGAVAQRMGRFEMAHKGTLFLDEVGDIPLELQPKLLRVLQEREFERLGSSRTVQVDVRLVTATNRDLAQMVSERQFRNDLYYRMNVFPITMPPLRERREDIPMLVRYFAQKNARRMNKRIEKIPNEALQALSQYHWPGNIRELENVIERAVILSRGPALQIPLNELKPAAEANAGVPATLEAAEREHILQALHESHGVIGGPRGAAARLGLKRTTLTAKMRKLGITRPTL